MSGIDRRWVRACERVAALASEHAGDLEGLVKALGVFDGFDDFCAVYAEQHGIEKRDVALLVALGAVMARGDDLRDEQQA